LDERGCAQDDFNPFGDKFSLGETDAILGIMQENMRKYMVEVMESKLQVPNPCKEQMDVPGVMID
jgi:hypothetical protein